MFCRFVVTEENPCHDYAKTATEGRGWQLCAEENTSAARLGKTVLFQCKEVHTLILNALVHDEIKFNIEKGD